MRVRLHDSLKNHSSDARLGEESCTSWLTRTANSLLAYGNETENAPLLDESVDDRTDTPITNTRQKWHESNETVALEVLQYDLVEEIASDGYKACRYDYDSSSTLDNLLLVRGTVLPGIIMSPIMWTSIVIYATTSICSHNTVCHPYLPILDTSDISKATVLLTFFLAFFSSTCYTRFLDQYTHLKSIEGHMRTIGMQLRSRFVIPQDKPKPNTKEEYQIQKADLQYQMIELFRQLSASYYLLFVRLYNGTEETFNLDSALQEGLITYQERALLKPLTPSMRWFKCLYWAFDHVKIVSEMGYCSERHAEEIQKEIITIREKMNEVTYRFQMPIPLAYYHLINMLTVTVSIVYSYSHAYSTKSSPEVAWIGWALVMLGFLGMREVSMAMADPFGDDYTDLPVANYVRNSMLFLTQFVQDSNEGSSAERCMTFYHGRYWAAKFWDEKDHIDLSMVLEGGNIIHETRVHSHIVSMMRFALLGRARWAVLQWKDRFSSSKGLSLAGSTSIAKREYHKKGGHAD